MSLTFASLLFNGIMLGMVSVSVFGLWQKTGWSRFIGFLIAIYVAALVVSLLICLPDGRVLRAARLLCFGWFVHVPIFLAAAIYVSSNIWMRRISATLIALTLLIVVYSFQIEPYRLEVSQFRVETSRLDRPLRVALLADFQTDHFRKYERESLDAIVHAQPDAIFMAGDYLQSTTQEGWESLRDQMNDYLHKIQFAAPLGIYAVGGNTDFRRWPEIFSGCDVEMFRESRDIETELFRVTGLSVEDSFATDLNVGHDGGKLHICLGHAPDYSLSPNVQADLLLAGHTHGGQVRLPLIGPVVTFSEVPRSWAAGLTNLSGGRTLVVSRGVGMERRDAPRLRFMCRPQIVFIDLVPVGVAN